MQRGHGTGSYPAFEAVAHDQLVTFPELFHENFQSGEVVAVIGIAHDDIATPSRLDTTQQRRPVPLDRHIHDPRTVLAGNFLRPVGTAVIRNQHFAGDAMTIQKTLRLVDAYGQGFRLVQARHQNR